MSIGIMSIGIMTIGIMTSSDCSFSTFPLVSTMTLGVRNLMIATYDVVVAVEATLLVNS